MFIKANLTEKQKQDFLKDYKELVVVGDYRVGYYHENYDKLKQFLFDKCDTTYLDVFDFNEEEEEYVLNKKKYNQLSLTDIDSDIQQVLTAEEVVNNLYCFEDDHGEVDPNYFCKVRINGGYDWVLIPGYFFE